MVKAVKGKRIIAGAVAVLVILFLCLGTVWLKGALRSVREQRIGAIRENVLSAAVQCYAVEGVFPPNLEYLEEHYGLVVDKDAYIVTYEAFSTNVMPDVSVLVRGEG